MNLIIPHAFPRLGVSIVFERPVQSNLISTMLSLVHSEMVKM